MSPAELILLVANVWGLVTMAPLLLLEWRGGWRPAWTPLTTLSAVYLGVVITGLGYFVWNYALERVTAARAAIFLNVQPLVGALLGVCLLGERWTAFTVAGGILILVGLWLALTGRPARKGRTDPYRDAAGPRRTRPRTSAT